MGELRNPSARRAAPLNFLKVYQMFPKVPRLGALPQPGFQPDKTGLLVDERASLSGRDSITGQPPASKEAAEQSADGNSPAASHLGGEDALKALMEIRDQMENIELDPQIGPDSKRRSSLDGVARAEILSRTLSRELVQVRIEEASVVTHYLSPRMTSLLADGDGVCLPTYQVRNSSLQESALVRGSALRQAEYRDMRGRRVFEEILGLAGEPLNSLRGFLA